MEGQAVEEPAPGQVEEGRAHQGRLHHVEMDLDPSLLQVQEQARGEHGRVGRDVVRGQGLPVVEGGPGHRLRAGRGRPLAQRAQGGDRLLAHGPRGIAFRHLAQHIQAARLLLQRQERHQGQPRVHLHVAARARIRRRQGPAQAGGLEGQELVGGGHAHGEVGMVEVAAQGIHGIQAARGAQRREHRGQHARVLVLEHGEQARLAGLVARDGEGGGQARAHEPYGVGIEVREHEGEVLLLHARQGLQGGRAHPRLRAAHLRHHPLAQPAVGRQDGQRLQGLHAKRARRRAQQRGEGGHGAPVAHERHRPHGVDRHRLVTVAQEGQEKVEAGRVLERAQAARAVGAGEGIARGDGGCEHGTQGRILEAHGRPGRGPPVEARLARREQDAFRAARVLQAREGEQAQARLQPGVGHAGGVVAADGDQGRARREGRQHHLGHGGRRARVADLAERFRRPPAHHRLRILERGEERVHRRAVADQAQREGRHLPHLGLGVLEQEREGGHRGRIADAAGGQGATPPHAAVAIGQRGRHVLGQLPPVLREQQARELLHARRGRRGRRGGRGHQEGEDQGCHRRDRKIMPRR